MAKKRLQKDRVQTQTEINRRHQDKISSIDGDMDAAFKNINWDRRNNAEKSLYDWVCEYMVGLLLNDPPPPMGKVVLEEMQVAMTSHSNTLLCMSRSSGKTSYCQCGCLFAIATGIQKYVVIISANQRSANNLLSDFFKIAMESDTKFAQDYPELCIPFQLTNGSLRRRQLYHGVATELVRNSETLQFARLVDEQGKDLPTSGSVIETRGYTGQLRGMKRLSGGQSLRPSLALLDDWEDEDTASSPDSVQKMIDIINKDVIPMGGKQRMSLLCTATPLCQDDLVEKLKQDKHWRTVMFPAIISYPTNKEQWEEYFKLFDEELIDRCPHTKSLEFYQQNFDSMNEGSQVFNPTRFSREDGHLSTIQKLLELKHQIGDVAFASEYQMSPVQLQSQLPINPSVVSSRISTLGHLEIPKKDVRWICASSDLNLSKYITTTIVVFLHNNTSVVIHHEFRKCSIPINIPEQDYYQRVYNLLGEHGKELKSIGIPNLHWVIDGNGTPFKAVTDFCRNAKNICGLDAACFIGKASTQYRSFIRSRLKEDVNRTLLCGDKDEQQVSGSGCKWTYFDSDLYHEAVHKGFLQQVGNIGSISWYANGDHGKWCVQVCGEKLVSKKNKGDGTVEYTWKQNGQDHDALDSIGQALAAYASNGFSTGNLSTTSNVSSRRVVKKKRKFNIV